MFIYLIALLLVYFQCFSLSLGGVKYKIASALGQLNTGGHSYFAIVIAVLVTGPHD